MEFLLRAAVGVYGDYARHTDSFTCHDCDDDIDAEAPMFYEADGDVDDGRPKDCSTYLCKPCGIARGYAPVPKPPRR